MHLECMSTLQSLDKAGVKQRGAWTAATALAAAWSMSSATELAAEWDGSSSAGVAGSMLLLHPSQAKGSTPANVPGCSCTANFCQGPLDKLSVPAFFLLLFRNTLNFAQTQDAF